MIAVMIMTEQGNEQASTKVAVAVSNLQRYDTLSHWIGFVIMNIHDFSDSHMDFQ